jgi:uncharacterized protein
MAGKFEVYKDGTGKYSFRLRASNGEVVASGEPYETRAAALNGCESVRRAAEGAPIVETEAWPVTGLGFRVESLPVGPQSRPAPERPWWPRGCR